MYFCDIIASAVYVHVGLMVVEMMNAMCSVKIHLQYAYLIVSLLTNYCSLSHLAAREPGQEGRAQKRALP